MLEALSKIVYERRKASGLSQQELADRIGVARTYLADIERGARNISLNSLLKVARGLNMPVSKLVRLAESEHGEAKKSPRRTKAQKETADTR